MVSFFCSVKFVVSCFLRFSEFALVFSDLLDFCGQGADTLIMGFWMVVAGGSCREMCKIGVLCSSLSPGLSWFWMTNKFNFIPGNKSFAIQNGNDAPSEPTFN